MTLLPTHHIQHCYHTDNNRPRCAEPGQCRVERGGHNEQAGVGNQGEGRQGDRR